MISRRKAIGLSAAATLAGCGRSDFINMSQLYAGPEVTHVEVRKEERAMHLWSNGEVIRTYSIDLGFAPVGAKRFEGDGKTPEGQYFINRRNPESQFFLSLGISYPNARDVARARAQGRSAGGDIFIHGQSASLVDRDWTAGCIALTNREMREIYWMIPLGTPITIRA